MKFARSKRINSASKSYFLVVNLFNFNFYDFQFLGDVEAQERVMREAAERAGT